MRKVVIGVMGPGDQATTADIQRAYQLGQYIAQEGWILLTGGRKVGVMNAASLGAKAANGLTVGILPDNDDRAVSEGVDIAIITDMGSARNTINVLSSDVVIACGVGAGTASEIALAIKGNKPVVLLTDDPTTQQFFRSLSPERVFLCQSPEATIKCVKAVLPRNPEP